MWQNERQDRLVGSPLDNKGARLGVFVDFVAEPLGRGIAQNSCALSMLSNAMMTIRFGTAFAPERTALVCCNLDPMFCSLY